MSEDEKDDGEEENGGLASSGDAFALQVCRQHRHHFSTDRDSTSANEVLLVYELGTTVCAVLKK